MKIFLAIILIIVLICAMGFLTSGFKDWTFDFSKKSDVTENNKTAVAIDENGIEMYEGEDYSLPSAMTFLSDSGGTTQTITARVTPSSANNRLDWSIAWGERGASIDAHWADDKEVTDYVSITVSDDTTSVLVTYKKPFAFKINIVATSFYNTNISATCVVSCRQKFNYFVSLKAIDIDGVTTLSSQSKYDGSSDIYVPFGKMMSFKGSISTLGTDSKDSLTTQVSAHIEYDVDSYVNAFGEDKIDRSKLVDKIMCSNSESLEQYDHNSFATEGYSVLKGSMFDGTVSKLYSTYLKEHPDFVLATLVIEVTVNGSKTVLRCPIKCTAESLVDVTAVTLNTGTITF